MWTGAAAPGYDMAHANPGTGAQLLDGAALSQDMEQRLRKAFNKLEAVIAAAPPAIASAYQEPSGRRRLADSGTALPHLHFGSHTVVYTPQFLCLSSTFLLTPNRQAADSTGNNFQNYEVDIA